MKIIFTKRLLLLALFFFTAAGMAWAQSTTVSGTVVDASTNETLVGVNIIVKGKVIGTTTDLDGNFTLTTRETPPFTLVVSIVGFQNQEVEITSNNVTGLVIKMEEATILGDEIIISASKVEENVLQSPVSVEKMDIRDIRETPAPTFYDALANLKSVDLVSQSYGNKSVNARGFNSTSNTRFVQLIDGVDNQSPGLNFPVGNLVGISELDLESLELIPGASSALYGPNAFNGILIMNSKSPFEYQGLSASVKVGANHFGESGTDVSFLYDGAIRYAKAFNDRFAFKVNAAYSRATDWYGQNFTDVSTENPGLIGNPNNPGADQLHLYGDEVSTNLNSVGNAIGVPGLPSVEVSRTGYTEADLVDYGAENIKLNAALHYRVNDNLEAIYQFNYGAGTTVYTGNNRYSIKNFSLQQHKFELRADNFYIRGYHTAEDAGDTYDARFLAINLNSTATPNDVWFGTYAGAYAAAVAGGASDADAHAAARATADADRLVPGTDAFQREFDRIVQSPDLSNGALLIEKTTLTSGEFLYNFKNEIDFVDLQVGGNYRVFDLNSEGTVFPDTTGNDITISEYGAFLQASKALADDKLKLVGSIRYDKNENFDGQFTPRLSAVWQVAENHNIRASFQTGFRNPSTQEQFIFLDVGQAILLGGTDQIIQSSQVNERSYTLTSVGAFGAAVGAAVNQGQDGGQAAAANLGLLQRADVSTISPEQITSFEIGYKTLINNKLYIDVNYYHSIYNNFLGFQRVVQVRNDPDVDPFAASLDILNSDFDVYQVYQTADEEVTSDGFGLGLRYVLPRDFELAANYTWAVLNDENVNNEVLTAFNTPENKFNITVSNRKLSKNLGFAATYRWQDEFRWEASFGDGDVPAYGTLDLQFSYKLKDLKSILKVGGSNILNNQYAPSWGAPLIGSIYYVSISFDEFLN